MATTPAPGILLRHLPAIYQAEPEFARFLAAFEAILLGAEGTPGLRGAILNMPALLDPDQTPPEFLPWLASWVSLGLRADLPTERKRRLVGRAAFLYQWRGTRAGLEELLQLVTGEAAEITEPEIETLQVGVQAVVGKTTRLGRDLPYLFEVTLRPANPGSLSAEDRRALEALARDTIELGKPAHTYYHFQIATASPAAADTGKGADNTHART